MPQRHLDLLAVALRARPGTVAELAELALRDPVTVAVQVDELVEDGFLTLRGDTIGYEPPTECVAAQVARRSSDLSDQLAAGLAQLSGLVGRLPALAREWELGGAHTHGLLDVEVFHGWSAVTDLWHRVIERRPLRRTDVVLPDATRLYVADPEMQATWHGVIGQPGHRARVLGNVAEVGRPEAAQRISEELAGGVDIRIAADLPGWFWVADGEVVALPLEWGETWPTSAIAVRSPAVAGLAQWVFDQLWATAVPVREGAASWGPLLQLMAKGATVEAASHALGISDRTGRRRIADAMEHYRAPNLFALGAAWSRESR
jgi:hypothetical protein